MFNACSLAINGSYVQVTEMRLRSAIHLIHHFEDIKDLGIQEQWEPYCGENGNEVLFCKPSYLGVAQLVSSMLCQVSAWSATTSPSLLVLMCTGNLT